jgi:hypothetical protein
MTTDDRPPELLDYVLALETSILGLKPSELYEIRVHVLRAVLVSWHELRAIANLSESGYVADAETLLPGG